MTDGREHQQELRTLADRIDAAQKLATTLAAAKGATPEQLLLLKLLDDANAILERLVREDAPANRGRGR